MRTLLITLLCATFAFGINDYYWRDYTGVIPWDAYSPGKAGNGEPIYIGQGFLKKHPGVYPIVIQQGKPLRVPILGSHTPDTFVQILCSPYPQSFKWMQMNATHLHLISADIHLVRGGVEDGNWLNIGRITYQGEMKIGKVLGGHLGNAEFWFLHGTEEKMVKSYEVLYFDGTRENDIDVRIET
ncbi:hypothetical protein GWI33_005383 [Rhynchophorus ferrugineus]|uniref:Uncharacterized protein n=1 Tax=Rhynchophorus ferrugineus TaxID=354439 RepID=A0A834IW14_RHYFE|nr:hypothetical protein GWI33_005383 [Rhynchophorus ferrugineus]